MILTRTPQVKALTPEPPDDNRKAWIKCLLKNRISIQDLQQLRTGITADELSYIIQQIYDLNERYILELSTVDGVLRTLNQIKNKKRNRRFDRKIKNGFRKPGSSGKVILAEGDSWFNYPILLTDMVDRIAMEKNFALHSLAAGGDWFLSMLSGRQYIEELSILHPDVFLISGGGNDLVGSRRLAAIIDPKGNGLQEYIDSPWAQDLMQKAERIKVPLDNQRFQNGCKYLSKDFFALLMFFHLQYSYLISGLTRQGSKFSGMKIVTQGYDYPIPSYGKNFGLNPLLWYVPFIRMFLGHGIWLKTPLMMRGITDKVVQTDILYAMIYLFNEMMIQIGVDFNADHREPIVSHIDSRGFMKANGWTDELHPKSSRQILIGEVFVECINGARPCYGNVFVVNNRKP